VYSAQKMQNNISNITTNTFGIILYTFKDKMTDIPDKGPQLKESLIS